MYLYFRYISFFDDHCSIEIKKGDEIIGPFLIIKNYRLAY